MSCLDYSNTKVGNTAGKSEDVSPHSTEPSAPYLTPLLRSWPLPPSRQLHHIQNRKQVGEPTTALHCPTYGCCKFSPLAYLPHHCCELPPDSICLTAHTSQPYKICTSRLQGGTLTYFVAPATVLRNNPQ